MNNLKSSSKSALFLLSIGLLSALFFSATFLINKSISIDGGHWYYSAFLRYVFTLLFLSILLILVKGVGFYREVLGEYIKNFKFWTVAGTIGFGVFYALICYAADHSPAWILVTTWQFTIFASLFVLAFFGKKLKKTTIFFTLLVVFGISLANLSYFEVGDFSSFLNASLPVIVAAFAFPIGNQMIWEEQKRKSSKVLKSAFAKVFLLVLGSSPLWIVLFLFLDVGYPSLSQGISVAIVSLVSGILATSLFLYARNSADTNSKIMIVDATISGEVIFTLACEVVFLNGLMPNIWGFVGIILTICALILMVFYDK